MTVKLRKCAKSTQVINKQKPTLITVVRKTLYSFSIGNLSVRYYYFEY